MRSYNHARYDQGGEVEEMPARVHSRASVSSGANGAEPDRTWSLTLLCPKGLSMVLYILHGTIEVTCEHDIEICRHIVCSR